MGFPGFQFGNSVDDPGSGRKEGPGVDVGFVEDAGKRRGGAIVFWLWANLPNDVMPGHDP